jgi:esterase/lipase superfamily enzyme
MQPVALAGDEGDQVTVLVATTRQPDPKLEFLFSGERSRYLSYAQIDIAVPSEHRPGALELPSRLPGDPSRDFVTRAVTPLDAGGFRSALHDKFSDTAHRRVLVFVHGYNNTFGAAVFRLAQIAHDSEAPVTPVLFTWPSRGQRTSRGPPSPTFCSGWPMTPRSERSPFSRTRWGAG